MKFQINFKSEDAVIYLVVSFALIYPLLIAFLIFYEDNKKKRHYKEMMTPIIDVLLGKEDCKKAYQMTSMLGSSIDPRNLEQICYKNRNLQIESSYFKFHSGKESDKITYVAVLQKNKEKRTLKMDAVFEEGSLKVISVNLN